MKRMFHFFKNIGWDRSPSFTGPEIRVDRIRQTLQNEIRHTETHLQMKLRHMKTIFGDKNLPAISHQIKKEEAEEAKIRAEEQAIDEKKPPATPL